MNTLICSWLMLAGLVFCGQRGAAQMLTYTHLRPALSRTAAQVGEEVKLLVNARIDQNWYLYASEFRDEVGTVVFSLIFKPSQAYTLVGKPPRCPWPPTCAKPRATATCSNCPTACASAST